MARSLIREEQVTDVDFVSHTEHDDPNQAEITHKFIHNVDVPTTYCGFAGSLLAVDTSSSGIEFTDVTVSDIGYHIDDTTIHFTENSLGLGTIAHQDADDVTISGGSISNTFSSWRYKIDEDITIPSYNCMLVPELIVDATVTLGDHAIIGVITTDVQLTTVSGVLQDQIDEVKRYSLLLS